MTNPTLQHLLENLAKYENIFQDLAKEMIAPKQYIYPVDYLAIAVINRSLSLLSGFHTLITNNNFIGAAHLVRPHLDNFLRFYAVWQVNEPHTFATAIINGKRIDRMKDRNGKLLKDYYLLQIASKEFSWMENVYKETSGFIHLSNKHFFTSSQLKNKETQTMEFKISKEDKYVDDSHRIEAVEGMIEITNCVTQLLYGWIHTKKNPPEITDF